MLLSCTRKEKKHINRLKRKYLARYTFESFGTSLSKSFSENLQSNRVKQEWRLGETLATMKASFLSEIFHKTLKKK